MDGASEAFYHGMMLELCAVLGSQFKVRSNRESGLGRFDIELLPMGREYLDLSLSLNMRKI